MHKAEATAKRAEIEAKRQRWAAKQAEKESIRKIQGLPERRTPVQKRIDEAYLRGVQEGRALALAEFEAKQRLEQQSAA